MAEHRPVLDPSILSRMSASMDSIREAWDGDVAEIRRLNGELENLRRDHQASADRADFYSSALREAKKQNQTLIERNAYLETQFQKMTEHSLDARDILGALAVRATESAREQMAEASSESHTPLLPDLDGIPDNNADDGTDLPQDAPAFLHRTTVPINEFAPHFVRSMAAE